MFSSSCTKEVFTEEDAYTNQKDLELLKDSISTSQALLRDSLQKAGGIINYSVSVVLGSDASWLSYGDKGGKGNKGGQGIDAVTVTIAQYGKLLTSTTDASGIATFKDLRIGSINVNVRKTGFTEVDFVAILPVLPDTNYTNAYNVVRHVGTMVPVFSLTTNLSTISGLATVETDLTNDAPEPAANLKIAAVIDVDNSDFYYRYIQWPYNDFVGCYECGEWSFDYYGLIRQIAIHSTISTATTAADGSFSINVPSSPDGLPIELIPSEFAANQSILQATLNNVPVWGVQTIRTMYGPPDTYTYSTIPTNGTGANQVQSAFVTFSAPTGTPAAQPTTEATATAVLASSGIVSVNMINQGEGYTQPPRVKFGIGTAFNSVQAEGTAVLSSGKITGVTITSAGSGYKPADNPAVTFEETVERIASAQPEFSFSVVDIGVTLSGSGYSQTPPAVTILGSGTGATAHAIMTAQISDFTMTSMGSGYTQAPLVMIADNFGAWANGTAVLSTNNPLHSIIYGGTNTTLWPASPIPTATIVGDGAGATANVTLSSTGKVTGFTALVGGAGYTSAPEVTITGGSGLGATATATVGAGAVTGIVITNQGEGYTSVPTFTFTGGGGAGASATPVIGFPVQSITLNQPGVGYNNVTAINLNNGGADVNYLPTSQVKINYGVRDITLGGTGYFFSGVPTVTFTPRDGNGSGAAATALLTWVIKDIELDNMGSGYLDDDANDVTVKIDPPAGFGTQATAVATLGNGVLSKVNLWEHGQGYTAAPNVYMVVDGGLSPVRQAKLTATVSGGEVTAISIADPGAGYDFTSYIDGDYYIDISTFNSAAAATAQANPRSGQIDYIQITNPGAGYAVVPKVEILNPTDPPAANGFGSGAAATATIFDGRVTALTLTSPGTGYYVTPTVNITVPWSSMTAVAKCVVNADGRVTGVDFTGGYPYTQGYGYVTAPTVTFTPSIPGKGTGAAGVAVVNDGRITNVVMTNQGSGYIGKNNPNAMKAYAILPTSAQPLLVKAGKSYIRDIYFGTGKRTIEQ